jgi:hypothetical protein
VAELEAGVRYELDFSPKFNVLSPSITGAIVSATAPPVFVAWQPSTWPATPSAVDDKFVFTLKSIFEESILGEINNLNADVHKSNGDLQHRGHVVAIALMCALDAIASYGYRKHPISDFSKAHFRADYHAHADEMYELYRCSLVHSWNLFEAAICPDDTKIKLEGGSLTIGLLDLFDCLVRATEDFLEKLTYDPPLQKNTLERYEELRNTARP